MTVNLARVLVSKGFQVGILDADVYGPSLRQMLPEDRLASQMGDRLVPALSGELSTFQWLILEKKMKL